MPAYRFSKYEMQALQYIAQMPEIDEELLANLLKIKESDARKLRTKLSKILEWVVIPNYGLLGWELLFVVYSTMPVKKQPQSSAFECCTHAYLSQEYFLAIGFAQNYGELLRVYEKLCAQLQVPQEQLQIVIFSHELTKVLRFFDYRGVLGKISGEWKTRIPLSYGEHVELDLLTRKVLFEIVEHPEEDEVSLSKRLRVRHSLVKRKRRFLSRNGYYTPSVSVNLEALGYKGFAFYNLKISQEEKMDEMLVDTGIPAFFAVADNNNAFLLVPYTCLDEIFEMSVVITQSTRSGRHPISIVNYGHFQFEEMDTLMENNYLAVLRRNRNFMFGDTVEGIIPKPKRRRNKIDP